MNCDVCGHKLAALFTSTYCPNENNHGVKLKRRNSGDLGRWEWVTDGLSISLEGGDGVFHYTGLRYALTLRFGWETTDRLDIRITGNSAEELNAVLRDIREKRRSDVPYNMIAVDLETIPPWVTWDEV